MSYTAYKQTQKITLSDRKIQAHVLRHAAYLFKKIQDSNDLSGLNDALKYNLKFWTIVQGDCLENDCPLPDALKANLISLSIYIDKKTFEMFSNPDLSVLSSFIIINNNIAKGLECDVINDN